MLKLIYSGLTTIMVGAFALCGLAIAQGGGGMGSITGAGELGRDRLRAQDPASGRDQLQEGERDSNRLHDPDRDRLFLGTKDRIPCLRPRPSGQRSRV